MRLTHSLSTLALLILLSNTAYTEPTRRVVLPENANITRSALKGSFSADEVEIRGNNRVVQIPESEWINLKAAFPTARRLDREDILVLPDGTFDVSTPSQKRDAIGFRFEQ